MIKLFYVDRNDTYKEWELLPNKLLIVEDIEAYLATKSAHTINDFQYIKNDLEIGVNIDFAQSYSQPKATTSFKYVAIQNTSENIHYYFVKKAVWRSKSCVRFELVMDVLNTFKEGYDYEWKANTKITREHRDRFLYNETKRVIELIFTNPALVGTLNELDSVYFTNEHGDDILTGVIESIDADNYANIRITSNDTDAYIKETIESTIEAEDWFEISKIGAPVNYIRFNLEREDDYYIRHYFQWWNKIDYVSEGINPILIRKTSPFSVEHTGLMQQDWYLLYRNQNDPTDSLVNPVECYLIPEDETPTDSAYITDGRLVPSFVEEGKTYFFLITNTNTFTLSNGVAPTYDGSYTKVLGISKCGGLLSCALYRAYISGGGTSINVEWTYDDIEYVSIANVPCNYDMLDNSDGVEYGSIQSFTYPYTIDDTTSPRNLDSVSNLDRTNAKNIKLIKLPYCPYNMYESAGRLHIPDEWDYHTINQTGGGGNIHELLLNDVNTKLECTINANSTNPFNELKKTPVNPAITDLRTHSDPKLKHSDFYAPTFVYDSFSLRVDLEKCDLNWYIENNTTSNNIKFTMTSTINSKFMFTLTQYHSDKAETNFYNVLPIARNNEEVLYNVPYINYIRTGYNYDIKNKNLQNASNYIGLGLSTLSIGASLFMPSVPLKVAGVIGSLVSMAMSFKSAVTSTIQNENSIKQKLEQYRNQASSVVGSDDVDLMSEYCGNRLLYMIYEPTDMMKNLLDDLFFYAGYNTNRMGIPTHNNRVNFDYLECDASIQAVASIPEECLSELIGAFKNGVTYLHKTTRDIDKWDFAQKYENWEIELLED